MTIVSKALAIPAFVCVVLSTSAVAGPLYKCVDAKGVAAYQQTPCPKTAKEAGRGYVPTVAPSPQLGWAQQAGALARQQRIREASYDAEKPRLVQSPGGGISAAEQAQMRNLDSQISALGSLNSRGKREMAADLRRMQTQIATGSPVTGAPARAPDPVVVRPPDNNQRFDQFGNPYTKTAPNILIDNKTGKPCITNGNQIVFCH